MDYKGYKLLDKILLICRYRKDKSYYAYLCDPSNKSQIRSARSWAKWTEYGPSHKNEETGKWEREYEIEHEPVEFSFDNTGFTFKLLSCASGSSQGGKLSFWNCIVGKDNKEFEIGINSELLLKVLMEGDFKNGVCQQTVVFGSHNGKCGVLVENGDSYNIAVADMQLKSKINKNMTTKYKVGDNVRTATIDEIYLGTLKQYYTFDVPRRYMYYPDDYTQFTLTKLKTPRTVHFYINRTWEKEFTKVSHLHKLLEGRQYFYVDPRSSMTRRYIGDKSIEVDEDVNTFLLKLVDGWNGPINRWNMEDIRKPYSDHIPDIKCVVDIMNNKFFGMSDKPFELNENLIDMLKRYRVTIIEEK